MFNKTYNISEVADIAGVSVATVSRYYSGKGTERTRKRIARVIAKTHYVPNAYASALGKLNGNKKKNRSVKK